jgi:hypothetical protein
VRVNAAGVLDVRFSANLRPSIARQQYTVYMFASISVRLCRNIWYGFRLFSPDRNIVFFFPSADPFMWNLATVVFIYYTAVVRISVFPFCCSCSVELLRRSVSRLLITRFG